VGSKVKIENFGMLGRGKKWEWRQADPLKNSSGPCYTLFVQSVTTINGVLMTREQICASDMLL